MNNFLMYGQYISLNCSFKNMDKEIEGKMISYGFFDKTVYFIENYDNKENNKYINFRNSRFIITPKLNYQFHYYYLNQKDIYKKIKKLKIKKQNITQTLKNNKQYKNIFDKYDMFINNQKEKLLKLKEKIKKEVEINKKIIKEFEGNPVKFGHEIQLLHYDSLKFINGTDICTKSEAIGFLVELSDKFSPSMIFEILPKFKGNRIGDSIQNDDFIIFKNKNNNFYLNINYNKPEIYGIELDINEYEIKKEFNENYLKFSELFLSQNTKISWQIKLDVNKIINNNIYKKDYIQIYNNGIKAFLRADIKYNNNTEGLYFYKNDNNLFDIKTIFEIIQINDLSESHDIVGEEGVYKDIILRHFMTNRIVTINDKNELCLNESYLLDEKDITKFIFKSLLGNSNVLENECPILIKKDQPIEMGYSISKDYYLEYEKKNYINVSNIFKKEIQNDNNFIPIKNYKNNNKIKSVFIKKNSTETAYLVKKISIDKMRNLFLVIESIKKINQYKNYLGKEFGFNNQKENFFLDFDKINKILKTLIIFLTDNKIKKKEIFDNYFDMYKINKEKQIIYRQSGIINEIMKLLEFSSNENIFNYEIFHIYECEFLFHHFILIYKLINYLIFDNKTNKEFISQYIINLINNLLYIKDPLNKIKMLETIKNIFDNNDIIYFHCIKPETITKILNLFIKNKKDINLIYLMNILLRNKNLSNIMIQKEITKKIILNDTILDKLLFKIDIDKKNVFIINNHFKIKINICEINKSNLQDKQFKYYSEINLFKYYMKFISFICLNKNDYAILKLRSLIFFDDLLYIINIKNICFSIKSEIIMILNLLYFNNFPQLENNIHFNLKNINQEYNDSIIFFKDERKKIDDLVDNIHLYLNKFLDIIDFNKGDLEFCQNILRLFYNIISKQIFEGISKIKEILINWISILLKNDFNCDNLIHEIIEIKVLIIKNLNFYLFKFSHYFINNLLKYIKGIENITIKNIMKFMKNLDKQFTFTTIEEKNNFKIFLKNVENKIKIKNKDEIFKLFMIFIKKNISKLNSNYKHINQLFSTDFLFKLLNQVNFNYKDFNKKLFNWFLKINYFDEMIIKNFRQTLILNKNDYRQLKYSLNLLFKLKVNFNTILDWFFDKDSSKYSEFITLLKHIMVNIKNEIKKINFKSVFPENLQKNEIELNDYQNFILKKDLNKLENLNNIINFNINIYNELVFILNYIIIYLKLSKKDIDLNYLPLKNIWKILTFSIIDNNMIKKKLLPIFSGYILKYFKHNNHVFIDLFIMLYVKNNDLILKNNILIEKIIKICNKKIFTIFKLESLDDKSYLQIALKIQILMNIINHKEKRLKKNKILVLNNFIKKIKKYEILQIIINKIESKSEIIYILYEVNKIEIKALSSFCVMVNYIFSILNKLIDRKNYFSISSMKNILNIKYLFSLINFDNIYISLEIILYEILFNLYLIEDKEINTELRDIIICMGNTFFINLNRNITEYNKIKGVENDEFLIIHNNLRIRKNLLKKLISYKFNCLIYLLFKRLNIILNKSELDNYLINPIKDNIISLKLNNLNEISEYIEIVEKIIDLYNNKNKNHSELDEKNKLIIINKNLYKGIEINEEIKKLFSKRRNQNSIYSIDNLNLDFNNSDSFITLKLLKILFDNLNTNELNNHIESNIKSNIINIYKNTNDGLLLKHIINYLKTINKSYNKDIKIKKKLFFIWRMYIEILNNQNINCSDWDDEVIIKIDESGELYRRQKVLIDLGITEILIEVWLYYNDYSLQEEALILLISLILKGNKLGQNKIYEIITSNVHNEFINSIKNYITHFFNKIINISYDYSKDEINNIINHVKRESLKIKKTNNSDYNLNKLQKYITKINIIFRFLQLLCEGHNIQLQNFLRNQNYDKNRFKVSISIIELSCKFLNELFKIIDKNTIILGFNLIDFMIESIQGPCKENVLIYYKKKILEICTDFMNLIYSSKNPLYLKNNSDKENLDILIDKIVLFIKNLIENNLDYNYLEYISNNFNFDFYFLKIKEKFINYFKQKLKVRKEKIYKFNIKKLHLKLKNYLFEEDLLNSFDYFFIIKLLNDNFKTFQNKINLLKNEDLSIYKFYIKNTGTIEIEYANNIIEINFIIHPVCRYLDDKLKENFILKIYGKDQDKKIAYFIDNINFYFIHMERSFKFEKLFFSLNINVILQLNLYLLIFFSTFINISFFYYENLIYNYNKQQEELFLKILNISSYFYFGLSCSYLLFYFLFYYNIIIEKYWFNYFKKYKKDLNSNVYLKNNIDQNIINLLNLYKLDYKSKMTILRYKTYHKFKNRTKFYFIRFNYFVKNILIIFKYKEILLAIMRVIWILIYLYRDFNKEKTLNNKINFIYGIIFLLDIIFKIKQLKSVLKAITYKYKMLFLAGIFFIIITLIFSSFAYTYIPFNFRSEIRSGYQENLCTTMIQCFTTILSLGPRSSGGIGDIIQRISYKESERQLYYIRYIFDIMAFYLINVIILNIVFGIIIDSFVELRNRKNKLEKEIDNKCLICNLNRSNFIKELNGLKIHLKYEHNIWNYFHFIYNLRNKLITSFNGFEAFIYGNILKSERKWLPFKRTKNKNYNKNKDKVLIKWENLTKKIIKWDKWEEFK